MPAIMRSNIDEPEARPAAKDFTIYVRSTKSEKEWPERYQQETDDPEKWGRDLIDWFNSTARPGEAKRTFIRVEVHGEVTPPEHKWEKQNLMTHTHAGRAFDRMKCSRCGITAKRHGIGKPVRDSIYRAKVYARCDTTMAHKAKAADIVG